MKLTLVLPSSYLPLGQTLPMSQPSQSYAVITVELTHTLVFTAIGSGHRSQVNDRFLGLRYSP